MTVEPLKSRIFVLGEDHDAKVNDIAAHFTAKLGVKVSRSEAIRLLISNFILPDRSVKRPMDTEATN